MANRKNNDADGFVFSSKNKTSFQDTLNKVKSIKISQIAELVLENFEFVNKDIYQAKCPFHEEENRSLKINDHKGVYKCFFCGVAGDGIKLVQDTKNLEFVEALEFINSLDLK